MTGRRFPDDVEILLSREIDDLLLDVRGLALVQNLLAERGASREEIAAHGEALDRRRARLAELLGGHAAEPHAHAA